MCYPNCFCCCCCCCCCCECRGVAGTDSTNLLLVRGVATVRVDAAVQNGRSVGVQAVSIFTVFWMSHGGGAAGAPGGPRRCPRWRAGPACAPVASMTMVSCWLPLDCTPVAALSNEPPVTWVMAGRGKWSCEPQCGCGTDTACTSSGSYCTAMRANTSESCSTVIESGAMVLQEGGAGGGQA